MDMVGQGTADVAETVNLNIAVIETDLNGFVDNLTVVEEDLFDVNRVREVWVLGTLRAAFVAEHYTKEEAVAEVFGFGAERYAGTQASLVGVHKNVSLYSYPIRQPRQGAGRKFQWEGR